MPKALQLIHQKEDENTLKKKAEQHIARGESRNTPDMGYKKRCKVVNSCVSYLRG